jgi:thioredoxin 1
MRFQFFKTGLALVFLFGVSLSACAKHDSSVVAEVTDDSFQKEVMASNVPVLVDFWATWCGPCRMYGPVVDQIAQEYKGKVKVVRVDVDHNPGLSSFFKINAIPRSILLNKGGSVKEWVGYLPYNELKPQLESALASLPIAPATH